MQVVDLVYNDILSQFYKSYHLSKEKQAERIQQVKCCNHMFVCTDNNQELQVVECIHCGLSNRTLYVYLKLKNILKSTYLELPFEAKLFLDNINNINLMAHEFIETNHARILYEAAREIDYQADLSTIFKIMKDLNSLETELERVKIEKFEDTYELTKRYLESIKEKTYKK